MKNLILLISISIITLAQAYEVDSTKNFTNHLKFKEYEAYIGEPVTFLQPVVEVSNKYGSLYTKQTTTITKTGKIEFIDLQMNVFYKDGSINDKKSIKIFEQDKANYDSTITKEETRVYCPVFTYESTSKSTGKITGDISTNYDCLKDANIVISDIRLIDNVTREVYNLDEPFKGHENDIIQLEYTNKDNGDVFYQDMQVLGDGPAYVILNMFIERLKKPVTFDLSDINGPLILEGSKLKREFKVTPGTEFTFENTRYILDNGNKNSLTILGYDNHGNMYEVSYRVFCQREKSRL